MATKTQIGAVIGMSGANQYINDMKALTQVTKQFAAETKALESTFDKHGKSIQNMMDREKSLKLEQEALTNQLRRQREELEKFNQIAAQNPSGLLNNKQFEGFAALETDIANTEAALNRVNQELDNMPSKISLVRDAFENVQNSVTDWGNALVDVGGFLTKYVTVPLAAAGGFSVKAFADQESAMTGVRKTVEELKDENGKLLIGYQDIEEELWQIALASGSTFEEAAKVAEVSGQLGIATPELAEFTKYMIALGDATNLTSDEAASYVATILNVMSKGEKVTAAETKKLGDAIVYLGNNYNTTEKDLAHMMSRLAPGAALIKMTTADALALATAMSESKITPESGGTAMTQVLQKIHKAFANYKNDMESDLPRMAEIAGMSAEDFAKAWEDRPIIALDAFIAGLSRLDEEGEYTSMVLAELDMSGIRQNLTMSALSLTHERLSQAIEDSNNAYKDSNFMMEEAEKRYKDFNVAVGNLGKSFSYVGGQIGKTIGDMLEPAVRDLTNMVKGIGDSWKEMPKSFQKTIVVLGGVVAAIGPVLVALGSLLIFSQRIKSVINTLGIGKQLASFGKIAGGITAIITGIVVAVTSFVEMWKNGWSVMGEVLKDIGIALVAVGAIIFGAPALITGVIAAIVAALSTFAIWVKNHWEEIKEGFSAVLNAAKEAWEIFSGLVSGLFGLFVEWISNKTKEMATNVMNYIKQLIDNGLNGFRVLKDSAINLFENMKQGVSNKVLQIKDAIVNGIQIAINWIRSLPSQAFSWGADMMNSMANGIRNAIGNVISAVSGVASRIRGFLHFSEPDVGPLSDFHTYMPDMMKMMAQGIYDNSYLVEDALSNLTGSMSSEVQGANPNYNYGGVVINLNVPEGTNGKMLVDEIETELANRTIRRKAVFG